MPDPARRWTIPVAFEGDDRPQLRDFARATGQSEAAAIRENCDSGLRGLTIGFAPGQPFIGLLVRGGGNLFLLIQEGFMAISCGDLASKMFGPVLLSAGGLRRMTTRSP
ncbi:hypothetical protein DEM26_19575 [Thioclava sp. NG1]|nr:hypothetical protein DEM26_19575 [Thioclava sp. NG1]